MFKLTVDVDLYDVGLIRSGDDWKITVLIIFIHHINGSITTALDKDTNITSITNKCVHNNNKREITKS